MFRTAVPSCMPMVAFCGLTMIRSDLNRPSALIWSSSAEICGCTLANMYRSLCGWCLTLRPGEYYLAAAAGSHRLKCGSVVRRIEAVGDDRTNIDSGLDQDGHLVPGLEHLPAVDALDRD